MNIHQHKLSCIIALTLACLLANISLYAQTKTSVFAHYNGVNGLAYINGMQQVHEYEYTYYVTKGENIELPLPFEGYSSNNDSTEYRRDEPKGYIRWYDYKTDMKATNLSIYNSKKVCLRLYAMPTVKTEDCFHGKTKPTASLLVLTIVQLE